MKAYIIHVYNDQQELGYFKAWSDFGIPLFAEFPTRAHRFDTIELAQRSARWIRKMATDKNIVTNPISIN